MAQKEIFEKKFNGGWKKVITKAPYKDGFRTDPFLYTPDGKKLRYHMGYFQEINRQIFFPIIFKLKLGIFLSSGQLMNYIIT